MIDNSEFQLDSTFTLNSFSDSTYNFLMSNYFGYTAFFNTYSWTASGDRNVNFVFKNSFLLCDSYWLERVARKKIKNFRKIRGVEFFTKALMDSNIHSHLVVGPDSTVEKAFRNNCELLGIQNSKLTFLSLPNPVDSNVATETTIKFVNSNCEQDVKIWISLGTPKQDLVGYQISQRLNCSTFGIGAAVDYIAYPILEAPVFLRKLGLEWFYRIFTGRRRLWVRYLKVFKFLISRFFGNLYWKSTN